MNLTTGSRVGPYEITGRVGAGGMGEVWRARDARMGRDVAIKVLPDDVAADPDRLRRFEQEARAAGSLNHPNLVTIHDVGSHEGVPYLVMELLEGQTLREKLGDTTGPAAARIPIRKAMDYAQQLASGLAAAHEKGIVHRDVKPDNIFVTRDGRLKVLDFGLARMGEPSSDAGDDPAAATRARNTNPGTVIGTVGYMSPEQVRGQETDHRSDIFATGAILYEMVSGRRAFRGASAADTMSAILNQDPPEIGSSSDQHVSPIVDRVIRRCLEKEKAERFESARDLAFALEAVTSSGTSHDSIAAEPPPRSRPRVLGIAVAGLLAAVVVAAFLSYRIGRASVTPPRQSFTQLTFGSAVETAPSLAPDGKTFVFVEGTAPRRQLFLQRVDGRSAIALSRSAEDDDHAPTFSPDGNQIAFNSAREGGGIFVMGATGESVRRITSAGFNPSWSPDGKELVFASEEFSSPTSRNSTSTLSIVNLATGAVRVLCRQDAMQPVFSPNGKRVAFWGLPGRGGQRDLFTIAVSGDPKSLVAATDDAPLDWNAVWAPDGKSLLFSSDRGGTTNLWRLGIDEESGKPEGEPQPFAVPATWAGHISVSRDGHQVLYTAHVLTHELRRGTLDPVTERVTMDPAPVLDGSMLVRTSEPSPDGKWIAFTTEARQEDVFVVRPDGSELRQLTDDAARDRGVSWAPDGSRIVFYSTRSGVYDAWSIRLDGSGLTQLTKDLGVNFPLVSPDGKWMTFTDLEVGRLMKLDGTIATTAQKIPPLPGETDSFFPTGWSPDGTKLIGTGWLGRKSLHVYSVAAARYEGPGYPVVLRVEGSGSVVAKWIDDHRILFTSGDGRVHVLDLPTGRTRPVADVEAATMSNDARTILGNRRTQDYDVWLMTLDPLH